MMLPFYAHSVNFKVADQCDLSCLGCSLSSKGILPLSDILMLIQKDTFFLTYSRHAVYNIYGGNPLSNHAILELIHYLSKYNVKIRLWMHCAADIEQIMRLRSLIYEWMFLIPSVNPGRYQLHVGLQSFEECSECLSQLKAEDIRFKLHVPLDYTNYSELPDFVQYALRYQCAILFHYNRAGITSSQCKDIHYFERLPFVRILPLTQSYQNGCCKVPFQPKSNFEWMLLKITFRSIMKHFRIKFNM